MWNVKVVLFLIILFPLFTSAERKIRKKKHTSFRHSLHRGHFKQHGGRPTAYKYVFHKLNTAKARHLPKQKSSKSIQNALVREQMYPKPKFTPPNIRNGKVKSETNFIDGKQHGMFRNYDKKV